MAESIQEQVAAKMESLLAAIVGDDGTTFWYTPMVIRTHSIDLGILEGGFKTIYAIAPDEEESTEESSGRFEKVTRLVLMLARRHDSDDSHHGAKAPLRHTEQNRMIHDVDRALLGDTTLGGLVDNFEIPRRLQNADDVWVEGWAVVMCDVQATYSALSTVP